MDDLVHFTDFETNAKRARAAQPSGQVSCWPIDWSVVIEGEGQHNYQKWIRDNCVAIVDQQRDPQTGKRVFAFEADEDYILFKMTF